MTQDAKILPIFAPWIHKKLMKWLFHLQGRGAESGRERLLSTGRLYTTQVRLKLTNLPQGKHNSHITTLKGMSPETTCLLEYQSSPLKLKDEV